MKQLFFDQFSYYCEHSKLTLEDLILQFSRVFTLSNELKQFFKKLPINSPSQLRGEAALIALASALPLRKVLQKKWLEIPSRQVDWAATKIESSINSQTNYLSYSPSFVVNNEAAFALSTICKVWISIIENLPDEFVLDKSNRLSAMREAYNKIPKGYSKWSRQISRIFAHNYPTETNYINVALTQWQSRKFQGLPLAQQLSNWNKPNSDKISPKNMESLFEWVSALAIASIAHKSEWVLIKPNSKIGSLAYSDIHLFKDNICLRIAKGKPRDANYHELKSDMSNMILEAQKAAGLAPSGFQPDIVLTFYNASNQSPECVTFLADAKFNESDDGRHYISPSIQKSAIYVHAFSKHLHANPKCTLFFWQGVTKYFGHDIANDANLDDIFSNNSYTYPEIQSFDRRIFDNDLLFKSWFATLEEFAKRKLINSKNK